MVSKKIIFGSVALIAIVILLVATLPIFIYGTAVNVIEVDTSLQISSSPSQSSDIRISQESGGFSISNPSVEIREKTMTSYEYMIAQSEGLVSTSEGESSSSALVDITMTFNLITPNGQELSFTFDPQDLQGTGVKHIIVLLGPEELNNEKGTFSLSITISIKITPPVFDAPVVDMTLDPVNLEFEVPA